MYTKKYKAKEYKATHTKQECKMAIKINDNDNTKDGTSLIIAQIIFSKYKIPHYSHSHIWKMQLKPVHQYLVGSHCQSIWDSK